MELEDEADARVAEADQGVVRQRAEVAPVDDHRAAVGPIEPAEQVQQGALADAAGAHHGHHLAGFDRQLQVAQDVDVVGADAVALVEGGDGDEGH